MGKDPAFLFYTNDFDSSTKFFTDEQVGKYIRLLIAQHQHGHLTIDQMNYICKTYDKDVYLKFTKDSNGNFFNERLQVEIEKRKSYSESRKNNRISTKHNKSDNHMINTSKRYVDTYDSHMENENENGEHSYSNSGGEKNSQNYVTPKPWSEESKQFQSDYYDPKISKDEFDKKWAVRLRKGQKNG